MPTGPGSLTEPVHQSVSLLPSVQSQGWDDFTRKDRPVLFEWLMDEVVRRALMLTPARHKMREHMDRVREQDIRLHGEVHPLHRKGWFKP